MRDFPLLQLKIHKEILVSPISHSDLDIVCGSDRRNKQTNACFPDRLSHAKRETNSRLSPELWHTRALPIFFLSPSNHHITRITNENPRPRAHVNPERERAKVKTLTEQLLVVKATRATSPLPNSTPAGSPEKPHHQPSTTDSVNGELLTRQTSMQRMRHNIPHRFNVSLPMRPGKCAACHESIQFGKRATICTDCQIMTHLKCSGTVSPNCGLPGGFARQFGKSLRGSAESLSTLGGSVQTLAIDEPDEVPQRVSFFFF